MSETILAVVITAVAGIITTVISGIIAGNKTKYLVESLREDFTELKSKVESHNNFGLRITAIETKLEIIEKEVNKANERS